MVMRAFLLCLVGLIVSGTAAFAVPEVDWQSQFGGPAQQWVESVLPVDGGYLAAGSHLLQPGSPRNGGSFSYFLARTDGSGTPIWQKEYDLGYVCWGAAAVEAGDSGFVMVGTVFPTYTYSDAAIGLIKTDADGNLLWTRFFQETSPYLGENTYGTHVQRTADGGYIVLGYHYRGSAVGSTILLVRTDADGNELWRSQPGDDFTVGAEVRQTADGGFIVGGDIRASDDDYNSADFYLLKTDALGQQEWSSTFGSAVGDTSASIRQTADGGYVLLGSTVDFDILDSFNNILARTDAGGNPLWVRTWGEFGDDWGGSVIQTTDGGFVTVGSRRSEEIGPDGLWEQMAVTKFSPSGEHEWELLLGDPGTWNGFSIAEGTSIEATADGGAILGGMIVGTIPESDGWGDWEMYLVKLGPIATGAAIPMAIDVKPGSSVNPINLGAKGTIPVAVLTTLSFNAADLDAATVAFAGAPVAVKPNGSLMRSLGDVDGDGDLDLILHFAIAGLQLAVGDTSATLTGLTRAGDAVEGSDTVVVK